MRSRHSNILARAHFLSTKTEPRLVSANCSVSLVYFVLKIPSITSRGNSYQKSRIVSNNSYRKSKPSSNENSKNLVNYIRKGQPRTHPFPKRRIITRLRRQWVGLVLSLPLILTLKLILLIPLHKTPSAVSPRLEGTR